MTYADLLELLTREVGRDLATRIGTALCREAAGESLYIPRRCVAPVILPTDTAASLQARYGVPRRTAYNWVNRWK
jgi:hypothetical protein